MGSKSSVPLAHAPAARGRRGPMLASSLATFFGGATDRSGGTREKWIRKQIGVMEGVGANSESLSTCATRSAAASARRLCAGLLPRRRREAAHIRARLPASRSGPRTQGRSLGNPPSSCPPHAGPPTLFTAYPCSDTSLTEETRAADIATVCASTRRRRRGVGVYVSSLIPSRSSPPSRRMSPKTPPPPQLLHVSSIVPPASRKMKTRKEDAWVPASPFSEEEESRSKAAQAKKRSGRTLHQRFSTA
ncbi:hypothetical protein B0H16DRAFT_380172 [Mycena metata]|uniref:Uncharacterized protein n=1 Tax=Mycena metata TaxID=1033252 RepID=A0AAD7HHH1_9AGAR|nr:hypothetical protein B0H16DRAFT_380172 [Mycena metata]